MLMENKNVFNWIEEKLSPDFCTSEEFIYNEMESQSDFGLPIIYQPFDYTKSLHWADRGNLFDYLYSTGGEGKKLLDFGPGDGWPSLIVAPYAKEVIGLDSSAKRIEVCTENAKRMGITNASFINYEVGTKLPFEDNTFDGVMAASSVEQTPNPKKTIEELYRVLKPGGRLRIYYEALNNYKGGQENDFWIAGLGSGLCKLILFDRNIDDEYVIQYGLTIEMSEEELSKKISLDGKDSFDNINISFLENIKSKIINVKACKTIHPSGKTYMSWLKDVGFKEILPSHSGRIAAYKLFQQFTDENIPKDLDSIDELIKKVVKVAIELKAPIDMDPMITAVK